MCLDKAKEESQDADEKPAEQQLPPAVTGADEAATKTGGTTPDESSQPVAPATDKPSFGVESGVEKLVEQQQQESAEVQQASKKTKVDLASLPTRAYLDQTIVPILLQGMSVIAKERPPNPIEYLATYLLKNKDKFE